VTADDLAVDQRERPSVGVRSREGTAVGATEVERLLEMAHCLQILIATPRPASKQALAARREVRAWMMVPKPRVETGRG
jgi:hypothetical protein